jgi:sarcosine oxidase subunit gamma
VFESRSALQAAYATAAPSVLRSGPPIRIRDIRGRCLAQLSIPAKIEGNFDSQVGAVLGVGLPATVNSQTVSARAKIKRITPDQYWLDTSDAEPLKRLAQVLPASCALTDLSQSRVRVVLEGPMVRKMLAKGISIDLHPLVFRTGDFALTALHHTTVLLERCGEDCYELWWMRTYAATLWDWLLDAARPVGYELNGDLR